MNNIIGTYCEGANCSVKDKCAKHVKANIPDAVYEYIDWSQMGSGHCDAEGCIITYSCGDFSDNYPLLEFYHFDKN